MKIKDIPINLFILLGFAWLLYEDMRYREMISNAYYDSQLIYDYLATKTNA